VTPSGVNAIPWQLPWNIPGKKIRSTSKTKDGTQIDALNALRFFEADLGGAGDKHSRSEAKR
jgi:hypothetical protein